jgi:hypothetical protein
VISRNLDPGGASYLRFGVEAESRASVAFITNGALPHQTLRVTVLRTR